MKKVIIPIICLICILIVLIKVDYITDKLVALLNQNNVVKIDNPNIYYKNNNYEFVNNASSFTPYGKQDILNIIYTTINSGVDNFTFYCPKEYKECIKDIENITKDKVMLTHLNNYVHPYNSFANIEAIIYDNGEINLKIDYLYSQNDIEKINAEVSRLIDELITEDIDNDYDKIKVIHDYIINITKYDLDDNSDNKSYIAYGPLFNHLATCNGYTDLMAIFLTEMGFDNFKVATTNNVEENIEGHVWNAVLVNDEWLHLDLTWDDPVSTNNKDYLYHKYFLIDTQELLTADSNITSTDHLFDYAIYPELKILN